MTGRWIGKATSGPRPRGLIVREVPGPRGRPVRETETCPHNHRKAKAARECGQRAAARRNREDAS